MPMLTHKRLVAKVEDKKVKRTVSDHIGQPQLYFYIRTFRLSSIAYAVPEIAFECIHPR